MGPEACFRKNVKDGTPGERLCLAFPGVVSVSGAGSGTVTGAGTGTDTETDTGAEVGAERGTGAGTGTEWD